MPKSSGYLLDEENKVLLLHWFGQRRSIRDIQKRLAARGVDIGIRSLERLRVTRRAQWEPVAEDIQKELFDEGLGNKESRIIKLCEFANQCFKKIEVAKNPVGWGNLYLKSLRQIAEEKGELGSDSGGRRLPGDVYHFLMLVQGSQQNGEAAMERPRGPVFEAEPGLLDQSGVVESPPVAEQLHPDNGGREEREELFLGEGDDAAPAGPSEGEGFPVLPVRADVHGAQD